MPVCNFCQGNEFDVQDGHYYCKDCHNQAADMREEEGEAFTQQTRVTYLATTFQESEGQAAERSETLAANIWTSWEGFNSILLGQVGEIEALTGIPQKFRFTVFNLWAKYLQATEIAFLASREVPHISKAVTNRDKAWINQHKFVDQRKKRKNLKRRNSVVGDSSDVSKISIHSLKNKLISQQYLSESSVHNISSMSEASATDESDKDEEDPIVKFWKQECDRKAAQNAPKVKSLTRKTLIGIIFLALRWIKSEVQLADLSRWIKFNHISLRHIEKYLPGDPFYNCGDKKLFGHQQVIFFTTTIKDGIISEAMDLYKILGYPDFPNVNVMPLVDRYLQELILPKSLALHIEKFVKFAPPNLQFKTDGTRSNYLPYPEGRAIAFIIFILKLLLGLNDLTEKQCSNVAEARGEDSFVWTKWVDLIELRNSILVDNYFWAKQIFDKDAIQTKNNAMQPDPEVIATTIDQNVPNTSTFSKNTKHFLKSLASRLMHNSITDDPPRPEPTKSMIFMTEALIEALKEGDFKHLTMHMKSSLMEFRSASCDFLMELEEVGPNTNLKKDKKERKTVVPEMKSTDGRKKKFAKVQVINYYIPDEEEESPGVKKNRQRKRIPAESACHSYWVLPLDHTYSNEYGENAIQENLPASFLWLLKQCAAVIDSKPLDIYKELLIIEAFFLLEENQDIGSERALKQMKYMKNLY